MASTSLISVLHLLFKIKIASANMNVYFFTRKKFLDRQVTLKIHCIFRILELLTSRACCICKTLMYNSFESYILGLRNYGTSNVRYEEKIINSL